MKVLVAYDASMFAEAALADLHRAGLPADTRVRVLTVLERQINPKADGMLEDVCEALHRRFPRWQIESETAVGRPAEMILNRAREWSAELIVMGTHGRSALTRLMLGSVSTTVARDAPCSVRIVRGDQTPADNHVRLLIGHDGSPEADAAVNEVCRRSWPSGTEARVVCVTESLITTRADEFAGIADTVRGINAEEHHWLEYLTTESEARLARSGLVVSALITEGDPKEALVHEARSWKATAVFVGARGIGLVERFLMGSVSAAVVTHASCTVEIVRR